MRFLSRDMGIAAIKTLSGLSLEAIMERLYAPEALSYQLPVDSGRKSALAALLRHAVLQESPSLLYVYDHDVFESEGNSLLFALARKGLGETSALYETPICEANASELEQACSLIMLVEFFFWSALIVQGSKLLVHLSHDEFLLVWADDSNARDRIERELTLFGLQALHS